MIKPSAVLFDASGYVAGFSDADMDLLDYLDKVDGCFVGATSYEVGPPYGWGMVLQGRGRWVPYGPGKGVSAPAYWSGSSIDIGILCERNVGQARAWDPTLFYGARRCKCKIWGPTWGVLCQFDPADFMVDVNLIESATGCFVNPETPTEQFYLYSDIQPLLYSLTPITAEDIRCAEGDSFEFSPTVPGVALTPPYVQGSVMQFFPGMLQRDFAWNPLTPPPPPSGNYEGGLTTDDLPLSTA